MTVYKFYISVPTNLFEVETLAAQRYTNVANNISSNMFIYDEDNDRKIYLYAFTNNKEYAKVFESLHDMNIFKKVKSKMDEKEFELFRKDITEKELVPVNIEEFDEHYDKITLICPRFEIMDIEDNTEYYQNDVMLNTSYSDYRILTKEFVMLLDRIGYCNFCLLQIGDEELTDYIFYNQSYGVSAEGYAKYNGLKYNKFKLYLLLFEYILKKETA